MNDFLSIRSFSWIPLVGAASFALTAAPLGSVLSLRDEILLGLALPPVGAAAIVTAVWAGVPADQMPVLYLIAVAGILGMSLLVPRKAGGLSGLPRWRAAFLASIFCAGEAVTILVSSVSTRVEAHTQHMLRGELLAIGLPGLVGFVVMTGVVLALALRNRGYLFALALDEESLAIKNPRQAGRIVLAFRAVAAVVIAAGVIWVGPLLTIALLAFPTMLCERGARGLFRLMATVTAVGFLSAVLGFLGSIALDMPPVPVVVLVILVIGSVSPLLAFLARRTR